MLFERTALAEAELEYRSNHESPSVFLAMDMISNTEEFLTAIENNSTKLDKDASVQAIIWTTTPWTLPSNKAIAFNKSEKYSLVDARYGHKSSYYIIASALLSNFFAERKLKLNTVLEFSGMCFIVFYVFNLYQ